MIPRYFSNFSKLLKKGRVLVLLGPRQIGKATLLKNFLKTTKLKYRLDSGDNIRTQHLLGSLDFEKLFEYVEGYELIAIDEAQQIPNIGKALKILVDKRPNLFIVATGSSSFDLSRAVGEPLTGRKMTYTLFPISQIELKQKYNKHELREQFDSHLIFGTYPEVVMAKSKEEKIFLLRELVDSYLLKDILTLEKVKSSHVLLNLVKLLAFQVGQLVSHHELATQLKIDEKTVHRYLDLLEKSFVICKLGGYSRNLRSEITKKHKYYFLDLGVRNAVVAQFNDLSNRQDQGLLWENFIFIERYKKCSYTQFYGNRYFWRTYEGQEVDLVEEIENKLMGYEIKYSETKKVKEPKLWSEKYSNSSYEVITPKNYLDFIT